jgi:hypothetical protein
MNKRMNGQENILVLCSAVQPTERSCTNMRFGNANIYQAGRHRSANPCLNHCLKNMWEVRHGFVHGGHSNDVEKYDYLYMIFVHSAIRLIGGPYLYRECDQNFFGFGRPVWYRVDQSRTVRSVLLLVNFQIRTQSVSNLACVSFLR